MPISFSICFAERQNWKVVGSSAKTKKVLDDVRHCANQSEGFLAKERFQALEFV